MPSRYLQTQPQVLSLIYLFHISVGTEFTVLEDVSVTKLGVWDEDGDGLLSDYMVTIFDNSLPNDAIASAIIPYSGSAEFTDGFQVDYTWHGDYA